MSITQQQQLALRRGVLYNASSNQFITFNPVIAGTNSLGPTSLEVIEISVPNLTGSSEVVTSAFTFPASLFVNLTEGGKIEQEVTVLNRVQGSTGSPYIFVHEVLSAEERAPEVGDSVESFAGAFDGVYAENTTIEEVNPIISFKIVDVAIFGANAEQLVFTFYLVPEQDFNLGTWGGTIGQRTLKHKFAVSTAAASLLTAANFLDTNPANKENLSKLLGYTEEDISNNLNAFVTFSNFVKDIFGETLSERKFITTPNPTVEAGTETDPPTPWINGFAKVKCGFVGDPKENPSDFENFPDQTLHRVDIFITKTQMRVYNFMSSPPSTPTGGTSEPGLFYFRGSGWNQNIANRPGNILFGTTGGVQKFNYVPSTGDFNTPVNNDQFSSSNDLFLYKLNQPLVNFISSSINNSKTSIKGLIISEVTTGLIRNFGSSINKNTLLDDWEAGYHQAGRILQNKLKK